MADINHFGYVNASKRLVEERLPVRFMYREKTDDEEQYSGWVFLSGTEDQEYVDNPDNIGIYGIKTILKIDNTVFPYLDAVPGMAFEREAGTGTFKVSKDFVFEPEKE